VGGSEEGKDGATVRWAREGEAAFGGTDFAADAVEVFGAVVVDAAARTLLVAYAAETEVHEK
jgi:hypothetical protein